MVRTRCFPYAGEQHKDAPLFSPLKHVLKVLKANKGRKGNKRYIYLERIEEMNHLCYRWYVIVYAEDSKESTTTTKEKPKKPI